jgi:hypothetical protein
VLELVTSVALYVLPLAALPFAVRLDSAAPRIAALSLFLAPLLGVATYLAIMQRLSLAGVKATLPFAVLPLGFWAALLAALATPVLRHTHHRLGSSASSFVIASATGGAVIGALFMLGFSVIVTTVQPAAGPIELLPHALAGLFAGASIATLAARSFVSRFTASAGT